MVVFCSFKRLCRRRKERRRRVGAAHRLRRRSDGVGDRVIRRSPEEEARQREFKKYKRRSKIQ